ncbi:MAG: response regulator [Acidobacteriota bacterium]
MNNRSLLVVDDSATFRQLLCMSLARVDGISSSNITEASDGAEAYNKVKERHFDLVLTDINMPNMTGLEFLDKVRNELHQNELPIIIITTKGADDDVNAGMQLGANGYLSKPVSMMQLKDLIKNYLK